MVSAFLGTNTGNTYVAGRVYQRAGEKYRAEADGSFTNLRTGRSSVGSSVQVEAYEREQVRREVEAAMLAELRGTGPGRAVVGAAPSRGAGNAGAGIGVRTTVGTGPGSAVVGVPVVVGPKPGPYVIETQTIKQTPLLIGGRVLEPPPGYSDAGDIEQGLGEGEFGSPAWFLTWVRAAGQAWHEITGGVAAREEMQRQNDVLKLMDGVGAGRLPNLWPDGQPVNDVPAEYWVDANPLVSIPTRVPDGPPPPSDVFVLSGRAQQDQLSPGANGEWVGRGLW